MLNIKTNLFNSLSGLAQAWSDKSFRAEVLLGMVLVPLVFYASVNSAAKFAVVGTYVLLLAVELLNTALERLSDRLTMQYDTDIKAVKDMGSAAVFLILLLLIPQVVVLIWFLK